MENENKIKNEKNLPPITSIIIVVALIVGSLIYTTRFKNPEALSGSVGLDQQKKVLQNGVELPVKWGNLGAQMIEAGVIDKDKFEAVYANRGGLDNQEKQLLEGINNGTIIITPENSGVILNLFWALGLGNKNDILEKGEMSDPRYGGAGNFASTGGWTIAKGSSMNHYSMHKFITLTSEQQTLVEQVAKNIYRPCCNNSTYFPDCNHGMAMLGFLELYASQGATEDQMYKAALILNSYWFPDTYATIATYMKNKGVEWKDVNPKEMLSANYSSGQGFAQIASQVTQPIQSSGGSGCGVGDGAPAQKQQSGCGVGGEAPVAAPAPKQQSGCGV
jgi:hypothetical protein